MITWQIHAMAPMIDTRSKMGTGDVRKENLCVLSYYKEKTYM